MSASIALISERPGAGTWLRRTALGVAMLAFVGVVVWAGIGLSHGPATPPRQVARIMLLPDTPPPPPPPEPLKAQPQEQPKQQIDTPKPEMPPEPEQLKMEGQAGEGPSPFASGEVKQEYIGGDIGNGDRYGAYIARVEQRVQEELTRRKLHVSNVKLFIWLAPDGTVQRYNVVAGDRDDERTVRAALTDFNRVDEAPQAEMPMPLGLQIN